MPLKTFHDAAGKPIQFMEVDGILYPYVAQVDQETAIRTSKHALGRQDDVLLCAFPKSGTHWMWEVIRMLNQGKAETIPSIKQEYMLEAISPDQLAAIPSPRVINTHFLFDQIPPDMIAKKCKVVLIHRNFKDVAVSHYNHHIGLTKLYDYDGKWEDWLSLFLDGKVDNGNWFDYVLDWERAMEQNPDYPIHLMFYEDMKQDSAKETLRLAKFLGLPLSEQVCEDIGKKCDFDNMSKDKKGLETEFWVDVWKDRRPGFYRKGLVGDWKHWFTVAQNEMFDQVYNERMMHSKLKFKFELS